VGRVADVVCAIVIPSTIVFQRQGPDVTQIVLTGGVFGLFTLTGVLNIADGAAGEIVETTVQCRFLRRDVRIRWKQVSASHRAG
jgi:hypothetical protein